MNRILLSLTIKPLYTFMLLFFLTRFDSDSDEDGSFEGVEVDSGDDSEFDFEEADDLTDSEMEGMFPSSNVPNSGGML